MAELIRSRVLLELTGLRHGFSTRRGGVSTGPYASLNLAFNDDDPEAVGENRRRFLSALGVPDPFELRQVHGDQLVEATQLGAGQDAAGDALVSEGPATLAVKTADCVPLLVARLDAKGDVTAVAAVHCGWRSTVAGLARKTVRRLGPASRLFCAMGPSISAQAFEVGPEVIEAARESLDGALPPMRAGRGDRAFLDLPKLVRRHLEEEGVPPAQIEDPTHCTHGEPERFFSYRRDGPCGHHLAVISWPEP